MVKSHDLNARTLEIAQEKGLTYGEARRELARRGWAARERNRRVKRTSAELFRRRLERDERMGLC